MEASYMSRDSQDEEAARLEHSIIESIEGDAYAEEYGDDEDTEDDEDDGLIRNTSSKELIDIDGVGEAGRRDATPTPRPGLGK
jgi:hypothetical protein